MSSGKGHYGFFDRVQDAGISTFKGYVGIIIVVFLFAGGTVAASLAGTLAVVGGTSLGIAAGEVVVFGKSVVTGHDLTKGSENACSSLTDCVKEKKAEKKAGG